MEYEVQATNLPEHEPFLRAYLEAAEWAGLTDEACKALHNSHSPAWDSESIARAREDCEDFQRANAADLEASGLSDALAGHDFYLTRNRHGAGFWDRGLGDVGRRLSEASHPYGETYEDFDPETEILSTR